MTGSGLLTGFAQVVTNRSGVPGALDVVAGGAVAVEHGRVAWVGTADAVPSRYATLECHDFGGQVAVPGFVDAHTHLVFGGDRADEFGRRARGERYETILAAGGGIHATVAATEAATDDELLDAAVSRARSMLAAGTTTVEVKSGYGLDLTGERRLLEVTGRLAERCPIDVVPTFLAHTVPRRWLGDRAAYVTEVCERVIPACAPLARFCDVFCDTGVFTVDEARAILAAGTRYGLRARVHADQLAAIGASGLAAEVGAASADHLEHVDEPTIAALAEAGVVAVLLPGATFTLRSTPPPARRLWDAGVTVALATDCNPGTSYLTSMPLVIALAVSLYGLSVEEALWAATRGGALALDLVDRGRLVPGDQADVAVLDADSYLHLAYRPGTDLVTAVFAGGHRVV